MYPCPCPCHVLAHRPLSIVHVHPPFLSCNPLFHSASPSPFTIHASPSAAPPPVFPPSFFPFSCSSSLPPFSLLYLAISSAQQLKLAHFRPSRLISLSFVCVTNTIFLCLSVLSFCISRLCLCMSLLSLSHTQTTLSFSVPWTQKSIKTHRPPIFPSILAYSTLYPSPRRTRSTFRKYAIVCTCVLVFTLNAHW